MRAQVPALPKGSFTIALLGIALLVSSLLAWQAHLAEASHRVATVAVLRDYASLAGTELLRRAASEIGYQGHYVLVQALTAPAGSPETIAQSANPRIHRAASLVRRTFSADVATRRVVFDGAPDPQAEGWLAQRLAAPREGAPYAVWSAVGAGRARTFVLAPRRDTAMVGYEVEAGALVSFVEAAVDAGPLLPPSLGRGRVGNARLSLVLRDPAGREIFRRGPGWSGEFRVGSSGGDAYGGTLQGFTAEVEIDPSAASDLVIGGLPRSRVLQVLALLGLAAGLLAAAVVQLRRERALERLRSEFVASVSHELRTPLTQIRMFAETMRLGRVRSDDERRRCLEIIDREARRLGHLVENLLQFSRSGSPSTPAAQELGPLVGEVVESFRPIAAAAEARLRPELGAGLWARVDADAWRRVLLNLLDNAVKYGPRGQEVTVVLEAAGEGWLRLAVEDEGPGIPPAERERVFGRFHRLARDRASTVTGTGLGLAVVRELVAGCEGRCAIESGRRGGARVVVELPSVGAAGP